jgi:hypothetical protein
MDKTIFITASGRRPLTPPKKRVGEKGGGELHTSLDLSPRVGLRGSPPGRWGGVGLWFATRHAHAQASRSTLLILWTRYYSCRCPAADKTDLYVPMCVWWCSTEIDGKMLECCLACSAKSITLHRRICRPEAITTRSACSKITRAAFPLG